MEHSQSYFPAICFPISDLFDIELNRTHIFSSDWTRHVSQNKIIEGTKISLLILQGLKGTDKL